jgi:hypothetical protein
MSNFILVHIGSNIPEHLKDCIKQIQATNANSDIILATNLNIEAPGINCININKLKLRDTGNYFIHNNDPLWITSLKRIFILDHLISNFKLKNTVHFDNDVLIYHNLNEIKDKLTAPLYLTPHKKTEFTFGFCFAKEPDSLSSLSEKIHKLVLLGEDKVKRLTGSETHEMRLLGYVNDTEITSLPVHPEIDMPIGNFIFDPSSYGQYLGGTPNGHAPGFIDKEQLVGSLFSSKAPNISFENKKPVLIFNNTQYNIFNLHIHSKNLKKFI